MDSTEIQQLRDILRGHCFTVVNDEDQWEREGLVIYKDEYGVVTDVVYRARGAASSNASSTAGEMTAEEKREQQNRGPFTPVLRGGKIVYQHSANLTVAEERERAQGRRP